MSGPKYSTAIIREIERLQQLAKQLEEQLEAQKRAQVLSDISRLDKEKEKVLSDANFLDCDALVKKSEELIPDSPYLVKLKEIRKEIVGVLNTKCSLNGDSEKLLENYASYKELISTAQNKKVLITDLMHHIVEEATTAQQEKREDLFLNEKWEDTGRKVSTIPGNLQEIYMEVLEMLAEGEDYEDKKSAIDQLISNTGTDWAYKRQQLMNRRDALKVEKNRSIDTIGILKKITELRSIYTLIGCEEKKIPKETEAIDQALEEAKKLLNEKQQAEYVAECVHKVFKDRGYNLLGDSIVVNNGRKIQNDIYEYGDDSLISVSMSNKGQMLFEVVGDGTHKEMDASRAEQLESEMRRFCPDYKEIKDALLRDYGISLEQEHLCEPDKKYAKAIDTEEKMDSRRKKKEKKRMSYD